jgi:hypothetical protein
MKIEPVLAPVENEETHHRLVFEMPGAPHIGDCVTISRPHRSGHTECVVSRTFRALDHPETGSAHHAGEPVVGTTASVTVECEFVAGPFSSGEHRKIAANRAI